jgi:hypothetical protein
MNGLNIRKAALLIGVVMSMLLGSSLAGWASSDSVQVTAEITGRIIFSILSGETVELSADPVDKPHDEGYTEFEVSTNAVSYSVIGSFNSVMIGDYDLIAHTNFTIWSTTEGDGVVISSPTVPSVGMDPAQSVTVLAGESGWTGGEIFRVYYGLDIDFTVPPGSGNTLIHFTATMTL